MWHTHRVINKPPLDGLGDGLDCQSFQSMSLCLIKLEKKGGFAMHIKKKSHLPSVRGRFSIIFARPHSSSTTLASTTLISLGCLLNFSSFGLHIFLPLRGCQTSLFLRLASGSQKWWFFRTCHGHTFHFIHDAVLETWLEGKDLIIQYQAKYEKDIECGGANLLIPRILGALRKFMINAQYAQSVHVCEHFVYLCLAM